jgi:hypothetical protein
MTLSPASLNPDTNELTGRVGFKPGYMGGLTDGEDRPTQALCVTVSAAEVSHGFCYPVLRSCGQAGDQRQPVQRHPQQTTWQAASGHAQDRPR